MARLSTSATSSGRCGACARTGEVVRFNIDRPTGDVAVVSRNCIPDALGLCPDLRRLGVGLAGLELVQAGRRRPVPLAAGFHMFEGHVRWTKGYALLPAPLFAGSAGRTEVELRLTGDLRYPRSPAPAAAGRDAVTLRCA